MAIQKIQIPSKKILFVGDSIYADIKGSENAGMIPVLFDPLGYRNYTGNKISNFSQLIPIINQIQIR